MGESYAKILIYICLFFFNAPTGQTLQGIFMLNTSDDAVLHKEVSFWGKKIKI